MIYGYARCSTNESKQDIQRQVRELKVAGAKEIFLEYEHGDSKIKSQQAAMFAAASAGDTIVTLEVPRLARSTKQLCEIIEHIREKKMRLMIMTLISRVRLRIRSLITSLKNSVKKRLLRAVGICSMAERLFIFLAQATSLL